MNKPFVRSTLLRPVLLASVLLAAGCSMIPPYQRP